MLQPEAELTASVPRERAGKRRVLLCLLGTVAAVCWLAAPPSSRSADGLQGALAALRPTWSARAPSPVMNNDYLASTMGAKPAVDHGWAHGHDIDRRIDRTNGPPSRWWPTVGAVYADTPRTPDQEMHQAWATNDIRWTRGGSAPAPPHMEQAPAQMQAPPQARPQAPPTPQPNAPPQWSRQTNEMAPAYERRSPGGPGNWATNDLKPRPASRYQNPSGAEMTLSWATDPDTSRRFSDWGSTGRAGSYV